MITKYFVWTAEDIYRLRQTISTLVRFPSVTGSPAENDIARYLADRLRQLHHPETGTLHIEPFFTADQTQTGVAALYKNSRSEKTVVLVAHTDVVSVQEFGPYQAEAFDVSTWTHLIQGGTVDLPDAVKVDLAQQNWWFGRGVMDMKAGLALNLVLFEKACLEGLDCNLVFLAVPDEESKSHGMLAAVEVLRRWRTIHNLHYTLCLNTEPSFVNSDAQSGYHIYSGSFGKLLLGVMAVGVPGHVGIPFSNVSAVQMISHVAQQIEANDTLSERTDDGQIVPPICLWMRDLQESYSVQSPHTAAAFFHVPFFSRTPSQVLSLFRQTCETAMGEFTSWLGHRMQQAGVWNQSKDMGIEVVWLSEVARDEMYPLRVNAGETLTTTLEAVQAVTLKQGVANRGKLVLFLAPPVYPAVDSSLHPLVQTCIARAQTKAKEAFGVTLEARSSFPGLSDLSYTGYGLGSDFASIAREMPGWGSTYSLPLQAMYDLAIPVCNLGPYGKDAHQWTERLELNYSTRILPHLSIEVIQTALA